MAVFYLMWVPIVTLYLFGYYWLSFKNNQFPDQQIWFWLIMIAGVFPGWAYVSKYSKNIIFDGMLYDTIMFIAYPVCMALLGASVGFKAINYIGIVIICGGFILLKI